MAVIKKLTLALIKIYQKTCSPDQGFFRYQAGPVCRFYPTCSEYTYQAIDKYGVLKGTRKGFKRIIRCHPWGQGGYDPVI